MANYSRIILRIAVTGLFLFAGITKLMKPHGFAVYGYSDAFAYFIASAEIAGAVGLWISKPVGSMSLSRLAALGLIIVMIGAIYTLMHAGEPRQGVVPVVVLFALTRLAMK